MNRRIFRFLLLSILLSILQAAFAASDLEHHLPFNTKLKDQYGRTRQFDLQNLRLDLDLDVRGRKISGTSTMTFAPLRENATRLTLDAIELQFDGVQIDNKEATF